MNISVDISKEKPFKISKYIHSTFFENFGKTTYDGIWVGKDSDIPNINGIRKSVVDGLKEAGITAIRWPGGCCADHYHWKWGIGKNRKKKMFTFGEEKNIWCNDFGTDEFIELCRLTGAEPIMVANTATGTAEEFLDWVEYCNGSTDTEYGALRAENGNPEPYNVKIWGLGNTDENVWCIDFNNPVSYAQNYMKFKATLNEMREDMTLIGLGLSKRHKMQGWVEKCLDHISHNGMYDEPDLLSIHYYIGGAKGEFRQCEEAVDFSDEAYYFALDSVKEFQEDINLHRKYISEHGGPAKSTKICFDEWGMWHPEAVLENGQRQRQTMRDALFAALSLHIFYRNSDIVEFAMETQTCNLLQSLFETDEEKCIKTPTFYVMRMFNEHLGGIPVDIDVNDDMLDIFASKTADETKVVISVVNKDISKPKNINFDLDKYKLIDAKIIYTQDVRSYNTFENPYVINELDFNGESIPPHSIVKFVYGVNS